MFIKKVWENCFLTKKFFLIQFDLTCHSFKWAHFSLTVTVQCMKTKNHKQKFLSEAAEMFTGLPLLMDL